MSVGVDGRKEGAEGRNWDARFGVIAVSGGAAAATGHVIGPGEDAIGSGEEAMLFTSAISLSLSISALATHGSSLWAGGYVWYGLGGGWGRPLVVAAAANVGRGGKGGTAGKRGLSRVPWLEMC